MDIVSPSHPSLVRIVDAVMSVWPEHERFLRKRFGVDDLGWSERVASLILTLAGGELLRVASDYAWMCERVLEEELHFRRTGSYRLSTFQDARREVYDDHAYMTRYMNGLLLSQVLWSNHTSVMQYYAEDFLAAAPEQYRHLEVGPGHGLLLSFAAKDPRAARVVGWDLSQASLDATGHALTSLGAPGVQLALRDLHAPAGPSERFDTIVISEVCEHLEDPEAALKGLGRVLAPAGRIFVNVPVNSPAPDHLYLLRTPEEAVSLVERSGLQVVDTRFFPATGHTLEKARKASLTISCVVVAGHGVVR
jgi:2-polyprenyl-3-methyl-5-hydroxy-6-metoxy-1,4-benzoquinol methylase